MKDENLTSSQVAAPLTEVYPLLRVYKGSIFDLTNVEILVNAANEALTGGGGIDQLFHAKAGPGLKEEILATVPDIGGGFRCVAGDAKLTGSHNLGIKGIIHTVGPYLDTFG